MVEAIINPKVVILVLEVINPLKDRITSEGIGGNTFSMAISNATAK